MPESPIPAQMIAAIPTNLGQLVEAQRGTEVATLVAAIVGAMGRSVSVAEVIELRKDVMFAIYPNPRSPEYLTWVTNKTEHLSKVR